eukprot:735423-Lingulodinium_polyedra.AAC.1
MGIVVKLANVMIAIIAKMVEIVVLGMLVTRDAWGILAALVMSVDFVAIATAVMVACLSRLYRLPR